VAVSSLSPVASAGIVVTVSFPNFHATILYPLFVGLCNVTAVPCV
jgi:hypothetical protein